MCSRVMHLVALLFSLILLLGWKVGSEKLYCSAYVHAIFHSAEYYMYYYRNLGNFRVRKFRTKNFRVKIFSWSTMAHKNILTTKKLHAQNFSLD